MPAGPKGWPLGKKPEITVEVGHEEDVLPPWNREMWSAEELKTTWPYLTVSQVHSLKEAFGMFDTAGKGWFERDELMEVMVALSGGNRPASEDVDAVFAELDCNADGRVDFSEFLAKFLNFGEPSELQQVLDLLRVPEHENGWLTMQSLVSIFQIIGEPLADGDQVYLARVFAAAAKGGSSRVALTDLLTLLDKEEEEAAEQDKDDADSSMPSSIRATLPDSPSLIGAHYAEVGSISFRPARPTADPAAVELAILDRSPTRVLHRNESGAGTGSWPAQK